MTVTVSQFRADFPAFTASAYPDAAVQFWLTVAAGVVSADAWGDLYPQGVELFTAHNLAMGPSVGASGASVASSAAGGPVSSKSVKDVSVSYDNSVGLEAQAGFFNATAYGRQFWLLRRMFGAGGIQLGVGDGGYDLPGTSIYPIPGL